MDSLSYLDNLLVLLEVLSFYSYKYNRYLHNVFIIIITRRLNVRPEIYHTVETNRQKNTIIITTYSPCKNYNETT